MEDSKPWYASTTIWASILQMGVGIGVSGGFIKGAAGSAIAADGPGLIVGLVTAALGLWSLYGRVQATKTIGG